MAAREASRTGFGGGTIMVWLILAALTVLAVVLWLRRTREPAEPEARAEAAAGDRRPPAVGRPPISIAPPAGFASVDGGPSPGGFTVSGRVIDASGGTIAGARVQTNGLAAESDGEGRYRLQLARGRHQLRASAEGYTEAIALVDLHADQTRDLRLEPAAHVGGRVVTADGQPVPGAQVRAVPGERRVRLSYGPAITDGAGVFRIDGLPPDDYRLGARKGALVGRAPQPITLASAGAVEDVTIAVSAGGAVGGTVQSQGGKPLAGARVQVWTPNPALLGVVEGRATTDREGRYRLEGVFPGEHNLGVDAEGYISQRVEVSVAGSVSRDFVMAEGAEASALVLDAAGRPAAGAMVQASTRPPGAGGGGDHDSGVTDADGRYRFKRLEPGLINVDALLGDDLGRAGPEPLESGAPRQLTVRLARGARLSGLVRWDDGQPAGSVEIRSSGRRPDEGIFPWGRTGPDGAFTVGPFLPGTISVEAQTPGEMGGWGGPGPDKAQVTVAAGEHKTGIALTLSRRTGSIHGVVLGPGGQPLAGVVVQAGQERDGHPADRFFISMSDTSGGGRAITGGDGAFALEGLAPGYFTMWLTHPEYPDVARPGVAAGTRNLRLRLERGGTLAGVVVNAEGQPLTRYQIVVAPAEAAGDPRHRLHPRGIGAGIDVEDARGAFRLERIPAGVYEVSAFREEGGRIDFARLSGVSLAAGETRQGLRLVTGAPPPNLGFIRARVK